MDLTTKYNIGQEVFVEFGKQLLPAIIKSITIEIIKAEGSNDIIVKPVYGIYMCNGISGSGEQWIHSSEEEYQQVLAERKAAEVKRLQDKIVALMEE